MYILSNGKEYVMKDPMNEGKYIHTTSSVLATEFTYKQARQILQSKKAALRWVKSYKIIDLETNQETKIKISNENIYSDDSSHDFDLSIIDTINIEADAFLKLSCYDLTELNKMKSSLSQALSYYDSAISDVYHARMDHRPPAHIRTKIDGMLNELNEQRRAVKQAIAKMDVFIDAQKEGWTNRRIKTVLEKMDYNPYKGRTEFYNKALEILGDENETS